MPHSDGPVPDRTPIGVTLAARAGAHSPNGDARRARIEADYRYLSERQAVVDFEFADGPLTGRRITGPSTIRTLYFYGFESDGRPCLGMSPARGTPLGTYRFERTYGCERTCDCVVEMRWEPSAGAERDARGLVAGPRGADERAALLRRRAADRVAARGERGFWGFVRGWPTDPPRHAQ